jgi:hypothetical protein
VINKNTIKTISEKEMDRKDFLKYSGLVFASVVGLRTIVTLLTQPEFPKTTVIETQHHESARGFGGGRYGV